MPRRVPSGPISSHALDVLSADALLPVCTACGTQYLTARQDCPICEDPRQAVPFSGQTWTSLAELGELSSDGATGGGKQKKRHNTLQEDEDDDRVVFIGTEPSFAIGQNPILLKTSAGSYIWDCAAYLSSELVSYLETLKPALEGIAISHPHLIEWFFSTSLTWARALRVPLYLNEADKEWYQRLSDIRDSDRVIWWRGEKVLSEAVKLIECGGHFPGSSVLHWDRLLEPQPSSHTGTSGSASTNADAIASSTPSPSHHSGLPKPSPVSGLLLVSDTIMVQPHRRGFTFIWSVPNIIPLGPADTLAISRRLSSVPFGQATSAWPGRFIRDRAREVLRESVERHLRVMGWEVEGAGVVPLKGDVEEASHTGQEKGREEEDARNDVGDVAAGLGKSLTSSGYGGLTGSEGDVPVQKPTEAQRPGVVISALMPT